jgi:hypothetical protein
VAVTGYDISRNGAPLTSVGVQTSFIDSTVSASTSYTYTVKAHDAASNQSAASNPYTVTTPAGSTPPLFSDDFESGTIGTAWTNFGLTISSEARNGSFGARQTSTGTATYATANITPQSDLYYRIHFKVLSQGANSVYLMKLRTATGVVVGGLYRQSGGQISFRNDIAGVTVPGIATVTPESWYTLELHATLNAIEVWLMGNKLTELSGPQNLGTSPFGRLQLGDNMGSRTYDVVFDDVVVSTSYIGP